MKNFELQTLVYNDNDKFRSFRSSDFNFILDKKSGLSICYGSIPDETPTYDPLSPEIIDILIDENFKFDNEIENINRIFNVNKEKDNTLITISTISTVNLIVENIYNENINEITKFYNYLKQFNIFINLKIDYNEVKELRDVLRLKLFGIQNIIIKVEEFKANDLLKQINLILSKNLNVSYDFYISKNNYEEFISLINTGFPGNTFSNIFFKEKTNKNIKNKVIDTIKGKGNFTICNTEKVKNNDLKFNSILLYQDGLFKCYIDIKNKKISHSPDYKEFISFDKIKRINSYWNSDIFIKYRNSLIVNKYEDIKEEKKDNK